MTRAAIEIFLQCINKFVAAFQNSSSGVSNDGVEGNDGDVRQNRFLVHQTAPYFTLLPSEKVLCQK